MHAIATWASPWVKKEWLAIFMVIQDDFEVSMAKDEAPAHEDVWLVASHMFEALEQLIGHKSSSKRFEKAVGIDRSHLGIDNGAGYIAWVDVLIRVPTNLSRRRCGSFHRARQTLLSDTSKTFEFGGYGLRVMLCRVARQGGKGQATNLWLNYCVKSWCMKKLHRLEVAKE